MLGYLNRDSDHQNCAAGRCPECDRPWVPASAKRILNPLRDIDFKHPDGWILYRLTRDMGCVRLTAEAAKRLGQDHTILNLMVLDRLIAYATASKS
jgi:hypothetical protein